MGSIWCHSIRVFPDFSGAAKFGPMLPKLLRCRDLPPRAANTHSDHGTGTVEIPLTESLHRLRLQGRGDEGSDLQWTGRERKRFTFHVPSSRTSPTSNSVHRPLLKVAPLRVLAPKDLHCSVANSSASSRRPACRLALRACAAYDRRWDDQRRTRALAAARKGALGCSQFQASLPIHLAGIGNQRVRPPGA